jgi:hypothetical protein
MKYLLMSVSVLMLVACKIEPQPSDWPDHLDQYMTEQGYTRSADNETILKDGYPVWRDKPCSGRGCFGTNQPLVPAELVQAVRADFFTALDRAQAEYVADVSDRIGIEPVHPAAPAAQD